MGTIMMDKTRVGVVCFEAPSLKPFVGIPATTIPHCERKSDRANSLFEIQMSLQDKLKIMKIPSTLHVVVYLTTSYLKS